MDIGAKLKNYRTQNGLTQQELADRAELTKGFISQVERNLTSPSISTLTDILQCLGSNLQDFFTDDTPEQIVFRKEDYFVKEAQELGHQIEWLVPNAQKNAMEPIRITLKPGGRSVLEKPHAGEEFGYVLEGSARITLGKRVYAVQEGETFYFPAIKEHMIEAGKRGAVLLWISTPPNF
ncbi:MAG: cupin domain-containing protein [Clostridia bacterium]|nr:cupin domain-containing protein [Clostridia bacterium]NCC42759.1 cupin domain-containing protein [Clostridia bacterium]